MPRNGSGTYAPPAGQPVVSGTVVSSSVFNALASDLATELTKSICTDGQTPMAAALPMGSNKITGLAAGTLPADASRYDQVTPKADSATLADAADQTKGGALIGYLSSFAGSTGTTVKAFLDRIISLGNGATGHSDGVNTITGSPRWFIGNNAPSTDDSALLIGRGLTGSYTSGAHGVRDESTYAPSGTGLLGYSSFDSITTFTGAVHWNHTHSYQSRQQYQGSGINDEIAGYTFQTTHTGTGVVTNMYGIKMSDALGTGPITFQAALWCDPLTRGASNYVIYSSSTALPSYHGGVWQTGSDIVAAGRGLFTGAISGAAIDSAGTPAAYGDDGGLGLYGYETNPYARIQAYSDNIGTGKDLSINSAGGKVLIGTATVNGTEALQVEGGIRFMPQASAAPSANGHLVFELTSNTQLKIKVKGSDGTIRSVTLTLA